MSRHRHRHRVFLTGCLVTLGMAAAGAFVALLALLLRPGASDDRPLATREDFRVALAADGSDVVAFASACLRRLRELHPSGRVLRAWASQSGRRCSLIVETASGSDRYFGIELADGWLINHGELALPASLAPVAGQDPQSVPDAWYEHDFLAQARDNAAADDPLIRAPALLAFVEMAALAQGEKPGVYWLLGYRPGEAAEVWEAWTTVPDGLNMTELWAVGAWEDWSNPKHTVRAAPTPETMLEGAPLPGDLLLGVRRCLDLLEVLPIGGALIRIQAEAEACAAIARSPDRQELAWLRSERPGQVRRHGWLAAPTTVRLPNLGVDARRLSVGSFQRAAHAAGCPTQARRIALESLDGTLRQAVDCGDGLLAGIRCLPGEPAAAADPCWQRSPER